MNQAVKRLKKNEKGLTLIELLAVLVILGIIAAIAIPMIGNMIDKSEKKAAINDALNIISAAKLAEANGEEPKNKNKGYTADDLKSKGYLDEAAYAFTSVSKDSSGWKIKGHGGIEKIFPDKKENGVTESDLKDELAKIK